MANVQTSDALLVKNYIAGDENSLSILINRHQSKIYGFIYSKLSDRDIADDIFQDTFIKVIKTLKSNSYNEEGKFLPWIMRISHNLIIDYFRKNNKVRFLSESRTLNEEFTIFHRLACQDKNYLQETCTEELESQMVGLIDHLPRLQKEIVYMRLFQDMSFKDIAEMENVSINTALGRMRYALINLRKLVEDNAIITDL